jgi:hypothetical protein
MEKNAFEALVGDGTLRKSLIREARRVGDDPKSIRCVWLISTHGGWVETYNDEGRKNGGHLQTNTTRHAGDIDALPTWMDDEDAAFRGYSEKYVYLTLYRSGVCAIARHIEDAFAGCESKEF